MNFKKSAKIAFSLSFLLLSNSGESSEIAKQLTDYDFEDIRDLGKLCHIAYGSHSQYFNEFKDRSWDIEFIQLHDFSPIYGIKACNGPLTVVAYAGTKLNEVRTISADLDAVRLDSQEATTRFPVQGAIHRGIFELHNSIHQSHDFKPLQNIDYDEKVIFAGHSLGGAWAQISALQLIGDAYRRRDHYPSTFCSLFTIGSPAFFDSNISLFLDNHFPYSSNLRLYFENDPFVQLTRGASGTPYHIQTSSSGLGAFVHSGLPIPLYGSGLASHFCDTYINCIDTRPESLQSFWPRVSEQYIMSDIMKNADKSCLRINDKQIELIKRHSRNSQFTSKGRKEMVGILSLQPQKFGLHIDFNYIFWQFILDSTLKAKSRISILDDFTRSYIHDGNDHHPRVLSLLKKIIIQNTLPWKDVFEALESHIYSEDLEVKIKFVNLLELLIQKNDYDEELVNEVFDLERFHKERLDFDGFQQFKLRILTYMIQNSKISFVSKFFKLIKLRGIEGKIMLKDFDFTKIDKRDIHEVCEVETLSWLKNTYNHNEILTRLEASPLRRYDDMYSFAINSVNQLYSSEDLSSLQSNHLRTYLKIINIDFSAHYLELFNKLSKQRNSFLNNLEIFPYSKGIFMGLITEMKSKPEEFKMFLSDPRITGLNLYEDFLEHGLL